MVSWPFVQGQPNVDGGHNGFGTHFGGITVNKACEDLMIVAYMIFAASSSLLLIILMFCNMAQRIGQWLLKLDIKRESVCPSTNLKWQSLHEATHEHEVSPGLTMHRPQVCCPLWMVVFMGNSESSKGSHSRQSWERWCQMAGQTTMVTSRSNYGHLFWWRELQDGRHSAFGTGFSQRKINGKNMFALTADSRYKVLIQRL